LCYAPRLYPPGIPWGNTAYKHGLAGEKDGGEWKGGGGGVGTQWYVLNVVLSE